MKKINCIAIDDEPHALMILEEYASKLDFIHLLATLQSPLEALNFYEQNEVDLLFLDIQMPELSGLQFLNLLKKAPHVILTTAYSDYALKGYEYNVTDYLLKPYSFERFLSAVRKVKLNDSTQTSPPLIPATTNIAPQKLSTIFIKGDAKHKFHQIDVKNIQYIEGLRNYVAIVPDNGKRIITLQSMKSLEEQLAPVDFIRIHKSYLININQVNLIDGNSVKIGEARLPIGGSYRKRFFEWVNERNLG